MYSSPLRLTKVNHFVHGDYQDQTKEYHRVEGGSCEPIGLGQCLQNPTVELKAHHDKARDIAYQERYI